MTKALSGLHTLVHELEINSGVDLTKLGWQCVWKMEKCYDYCVMGYLHLCDCVSFVRTWLIAYMYESYNFQDSGEIDDTSDGDIWTNPKLWPVEYKYMAWT